MATYRFEGGGKLKEKLAELSKKVNKAKQVNVGFPAGATEENGASLPMVAAIQEFGAPAKGIPPRPFFRTMIAKNEDHWVDDLMEQLRIHDMDVEKALAVVGDSMAGELRQSIIDVTEPALSDVTLLLRERFGNNPGAITFADVQRAREDIQAGIKPNVTGTQAKPLVWTGSMLNGIVSEVE